MKIKILLFLITIHQFSFGQNFTWVNSSPVNNALNPDFTRAKIEVTSAEEIITSHMKTVAFYFGQDVMGTYQIEKSDSAGNTIWTFDLTDSVIVRLLESDAQGNLYIAGGFMGTMVLPGGQLMQNSTGHWNIDEFILKISPAGNLIWSKNLTVPLNFYVLRSMKVDPSGTLWYSRSDFQDAVLYKSDANGNPVDSVTFNNCKWISSFDFDSNGNIYCAGATSNGNVYIGTDSLFVNETYAFYVCKLDSAFQLQWIQIGHDETFHLPQLIFNNGSVLVCSDIIDTVTWGSITLGSNQFSLNFFLVKFDPAGNVLWGKDVPMTIPLTGTFGLAGENSMAVNQRGEIFLYGNVNGTINWGNGVSVSTAMIDRLMHIVSFDSNGNALWQKTFGASNGNNPYSIAVSDVACYNAQLMTSTGNFDVFTAGPSSTPQEFVLSKLNYPITLSVNDINVNSIAFYPNPSSHLIHFDNNLRKEIYDVKMQLIATIESDSWDVKSVPAGLYFIKSQGKAGRVLVCH